MDEGWEVGGEEEKIEEAEEGGREEEGEEDIFIQLSVPHM